MARTRRTTASGQFSPTPTVRCVGELVEFLRELDVDELNALVGLMWIGRGDFEADDWRDAVAAAADRHEGPTWKYLLGIPLLPDYLEDALSAFGRSCGGFWRRGNNVRWRHWDVLIRRTAGAVADLVETWRNPTTVVRAVAGASG